MVRNLRAKYVGNPKVVVACLYCNFKERSIQTPSNMIAAVLRQLVVDRQSLADEVQDLYEACSASGIRPNMSEISKVLKAEVDRLERAYILVDALDEYQQNWFLVSLVSELRALSLKAILLITSPFDENIQSMLEGAQTIEISADAQDIRTYVAGRVARSTQLVRHAEKDPALTDTIASTIVEKAGKM